MTDSTPAAVDVPDDDAYRCRYCDRAFPTERQRTLHKGLNHPERIDDDEREAFRRAYSDENDDIRRFRLKVLGLLVLLYFLLLFVYLLVT